MKSVVFGLLLCLSQIAMASPRTVMVQLFEWPWKDVARECEIYLGPNGFSAVQVSPAQEHLVLGQASWWERYQPVSYKIASRSGNEDEFSRMVQICHQAGVDIYVDTVLNHMAGMATGRGFAGTTYSKYNHSGLYTYADFHHCGRNGNDQILNYQDRWEVQNCELLGLADLKTESLQVQQNLNEYLLHLLSLGVAGFRLDAAKHIPAMDLMNLLKSLYSQTNKTPFIVSETSIAGGEPISIAEYFPVGHVNYFRYPYDLGAAFNQARLGQLPGNFSGYIDSNKAVVFLLNHDLQRASSDSLVSLQKNPKAYQLATVFMLTWPYGYPQIFSGYDFSNYNQGPPVETSGRTRPVLSRDGQCQAPWLCEHRLPGVSALVGFRNFTDPAFYANNYWFGNDGQLAFSRGSLGFVVINSSPSPLSTQISTSLRDGCYCNIFSDKANHCRVEGGAQSLVNNSASVQVQGGFAAVTLDPQSAVVLRSDRLCEGVKHGGKY